MHKDIITRLEGQLSSEESLERKLATKADKSELSSFASKGDIDSIQVALGKKLDVDAYLKVATFDDYKADAKNIIEAIQKELGRKVGLNEVAQIERQLESKIKGIKDAIEDNISRSEVEAMIGSHDTMTAGEIELRLSKLKRELLNEIKKRLEDVGGGVTIVSQKGAGGGASAFSVDDILVFTIEQDTIVTQNGNLMTFVGS